MVGGGLAPARLDVEAPTVQGADELVALDLAEHREVGVAVWAPTLYDVTAQLEVGLGLRRRVELADRFCLGASHPLDRQ